MQPSSTNIMPMMTAKFNKAPFKSNHYNHDTRYTAVSTLPISGYKKTNHANQSNCWTVWILDANWHIWHILV